MNNNEIVARLWGLADILRDDGITYHEYVTELTYLLFLKMMQEQDAESIIPEGKRWRDLVSKEGIELKTFYRQLLLDLGNEEIVNESLRMIYNGASTSIDEPKNLEKIIKSIDNLDWYSAKEEGLGNLYEGLLEKNASEKKSGAGQYFTPRVLIDVMVQLMDPKIGERINDPAAGTFGFMIAADHYLKQQTDNYFDLSPEEAEFQKREAFTGMELVKDTHRLAIMNALLHDMEGRLDQGDSLSSNGKWMKNYDVVLTNPPFGTKKGGERATRDDLTFETSNKQFNFLQTIYNSLVTDGTGRAAVVLPDNILFDTEIGVQIRRDLMNKCRLHTILRLPEGIFYARGIKTNVLFFERGTSDIGNTTEVWVYDLRTNMPKFGKRTPLTIKHFEKFIEAYNTRDRKLVSDNRWSVFSREYIEKNDSSLNIGLIEDDSLSAFENLPNHIDLTEDILLNLEKTIELVRSIEAELVQKEDYETEELLSTDENNPYSIPNSWEWVRLGDLTTSIQYGYTESASFEEIGPNFLRITDIQKDKVDWNKVPYCSIEESDIEKFKLFDGDIVIARTGATTGKSYLINNPPEAVFASYLIRISLKEDVNKQYIQRYLQSPSYWKQIMVVKKGSAQPGANATILSNLMIPLPPIEQQEQIVDKLEEILSKIEEINLLLYSDESLADINTLKQIVLDNAFKGKFI